MVTSVYKPSLTQIKNDTFTTFNKDKINFVTLIVSAASGVKMMTEMGRLLYSGQI